MFALDLAPGAGVQHGAMATANFDRETLRALADESNETALDRLADLAEARADLDELSELLDEGCVHAGHLLTRRAVAAGDLLELHRISDAGCDEAGAELERLLSAPGVRRRRAGGAGRPGGHPGACPRWPGRRW